jgi:hypothetical protein
MVRTSIQRKRRRSSVRSRRMATVDGWDGRVDTLQSPVLSLVYR